jgi:hypothetical protein
MRLHADSNARIIDDSDGPAIVASLELPGFQEIIMDVLPEPRGDPGALAAANSEIATETNRYARSLLLRCPGHKPSVNVDGTEAD